MYLVYIMYLFFCIVTSVLMRSSDGDEIYRIKKHEEILIVKNGQKILMYNLFHGEICTIGCGTFFYFRAQAS